METDSAYSEIGLLYPRLTARYESQLSEPVQRSYELDESLQQQIDNPETRPPAIFLERSRQFAALVTDMLPDSFFEEELVSSHIHIQSVYAAAYKRLLESGANPDSEMFVRVIGPHSQGTEWVSGPYSSTGALQHFFTGDIEDTLFEDTTPEPPDPPTQAHGGRHQDFYNMTVELLLSTSPYLGETHSKVYEEALSYMQDKAASHREWLKKERQRLGLPVNSDLNQNVYLVSSLKRSAPLSNISEVGANDGIPGFRHQGLLQGPILLQDCQSHLRCLIPDCLLRLSEESCSTLTHMNARIFR
ncbi:MAG: hypothetical protein TR69_WS6001000058 [candidate division WS6 bacterium OLB20]|uniref:Uncharacterized protein n=1 Tax=candidate division WS6 bacterium OLB20 TaxID=1617426 RepID=A0A136M140_9BACT|nr:MAG: hypothetical protein TR69_WS6001000058 [candidate division WS6 bacterium OLB20]